MNCKCCGNALSNTDITKLLFAFDRSARIESQSKEQPLMPVIKESLYPDPLSEYSCPNCKNDFYYPEPGERCNFCGQKLLPVK